MYITRTALLIKIPFLLLPHSVFLFLVFSLISKITTTTSIQKKQRRRCLLALGSYLWSYLSACICDQFLIQSIYFFFVASYVWGQRCCRLHNFYILWNGRLSSKKSRGYGIIINDLLETKINKFRTEFTDLVGHILTIVNHIGCNMIL